MQILWLLSKGNTHGYKLMKDLNDLKRTKITQGTLYPTLKKLENMRLIKSRKSKNKRIFSLTKKGKTVMINSCEDFTRTFHGIFEDFVCEKCGCKL